MNNKTEETNAETSNSEIRNSNSKQESAESGNLLHMHEQTAQLFQFVLDWRYKLFAGFLIIVGTLGYSIIETDNKFKILILLVCIIAVSRMFHLLSRKNTQDYWKLQNYGYKVEQELNLKETKEGDKGMFARLVHEDKKGAVESSNYNGLNSILKYEVKELYGCKTHTGVINWTFLAVGFLACIYVVYLLYDNNWS